MAYSLSIRKEAEADIAEAFQYYENCGDSLGSEFILCIDESFSRIKKNPKQYKTIYKNVHRALVRRFPFGVYYVLKPNQIIIIGVVHARKSPKHWRARV